MKLLVLGSGGREHALAWKISQSDKCEAVFLHPGNGGTAKQFPDLGHDVAGPQQIAEKVLELEIDLIVIGPETFLAQGYADSFRSKNLPVVGPSANWAQLESSKVYAKEFMQRAGIPTTTTFAIVDNGKDLCRKTEEQGQWPIVLKLDGLAQGKGVVIAQRSAEVEHFAKRIWSDLEFGPAPQRVIVEEFVKGRELSYIGLCDGKTFLPFASAVDFKRVGDQDTGGNTGGMGGLSPSPYFSKDLETAIQEKIIRKMLTQFGKEHADYRGALYVGLMITDDNEPVVLEFNARFGDPETQVTLPRLKSDFVTLLWHTAQGTLSSCPAPKWHDDVSLVVVATAQGYPGKVRVGDQITGLDQMDEGILTFYAGVKADGGELLTSGGRVLALGGLAGDFRAARNKVYINLSRIHWDGMHYRRDIGQFDEKGMT